MKRVIQFCMRCFLVFVTLCLVVGCSSTVKRADFLSTQAKLKTGKYVDSYWPSASLSKAELARIYIEPIDITRIKDEPGVEAKVAAELLKREMAFNLESHLNCKIVAETNDCTARLALAITFMTPGSKQGRMWAAELGVGHAIVQVEGRLMDQPTGAELACFADRRRDSGAVGFEDFGGDAGPRLVTRLLNFTSINFAKELALTRQ